MHTFSPGKLPRDDHNWPNTSGLYATSTRKTLGKGKTPYSTFLQTLPRKQKQTIMMFIKGWIYISVVQHIPIFTNSTSLPPTRKKTHLLELLVFGTSCFCQKSFSQFLQVSGVIHLNLSLFAEKILQVLEQLDSKLTLLIKTFQLFNKLGSDLCRGRGE